MADMQPHNTPPAGELTAPEPVYGTTPNAADPYLKLMQPDDTVLISKGGDYRIYQETLRDPSCQSAFEQRRLAVTSKEWIVEAGANDALSKAAADWLREQMQELEWDRITNGMLYARWYGHAVAECLFQPDMVEGKVALADIRVRDRSRFNYANDNGPPFIQREGKWVRLPERKMWTVSTGADHDDSPYGLGLAHYCYWPVFFKRNNIKFWLIFLEKFGLPTVVTKMPLAQFNDPATRARVREAVAAMASETGIILPEGATFEFATAAKSGTQDYDTMRAAMDAEITRVIIGQTASSQGTPGKLGNEELQGQVKDELVKADSDLICGSFNRTVVTWLTQWNFPGATPPRVWRVLDRGEDTTVTANRDKTLGELGWERTDESFVETYGQGYQRKPAPVMPAGMFGTGQAGLSEQEAANFAEAAMITALKAGRRGDQASMAAAARQFASQYEGLMGERVQQLLSYAEESGDFATFNAHLLRMAQEAAPASLAHPIANGGFFAQLLGRIRSAR